MASVSFAMAVAEREECFGVVMSEEVRDRDGRGALVAAAAADAATTVDADELPKEDAGAGDGPSLFSRVLVSLLSS